VLIRGLTGIATKPTVSLPAISLGDHALAARRAVVLDREDASHDAAGILGMDVLADFVLRIDADAGKIGFYPVTEEAPRLPARFRRVPLSGGPPAQRNYGLLFASVRIAGREVPALVDTGSDFSAMNWHAALLHGDLRRIHNDLRRAWRVAGATGDFRPRTTVTVGRVPMGGWQWIDQRFLVLPLDGLSVLGADRLPLVILGADMLSGRDVVLDPRRQQLFIAPAAGTSENIAREIGTP
jgi:predicted aspartyl protease